MDEAEDKQSGTRSSIALLCNTNTCKHFIATPLHARGSALNLRTDSDNVHFIGINARNTARKIPKNIIHLQHLSKQITVLVNQ